MKGPLLDVRCAAASYYGAAHAALSGVSFSADRSERIGLIGPNGSGKTTLLHAIAGSHPLEGGSIWLGGRDSYALKPRERARSVALLAQAQPDAFRQTVGDAVALGRYPYRRGLFGAWTPDDERAISDALARTDLLAARGRPLESLSGGERQRALFAGALAQGADVLLLDEPANHLDPAYRLQLLDMAGREAAAGKLVLASFHDLPAAAAFCSRLLVLKGGRLLADGPPATVLQPGLLKEAFGVAFDVFPHPSAGYPVALAARAASKKDAEPM